MSISINNTLLNNQPSFLREYLLQIQTDQTSLNGSMTRNRIGQKKVSEMTFSIMSPADYQVLINYFTTGSGVYYYNDATDYGSVFAFSGLPTFQENPYTQGSSLYRDFQVTIREI
jgi:hypothetical protein